MKIQPDRVMNVKAADRDVPILGISLPADVLLGEPACKAHELLFDTWGDQTGLLDAVHRMGVHWVEIRTVHGHTADQVLQMAECIWKAGMQLTVHGHVTCRERAVEQVLSPLVKLLSAKRQPMLTVTLHPIAEDCIGMLTDLSDEILRMQAPVTIALENNRKRPDGQQGDPCEMVRALVEQVDRANVGICFDMGHFCYRWLNRNGEDAVLPSPEFLKRVVHTHIHDVKQGRTHFPLNPPLTLPLPDTLESFYYDGVYNLELDFPRFCDSILPKDAVEISIEVLKAAIPIRSLAQIQIEEHLQELWTNAGRSLSIADSAVSFTSASGCLVKVGESCFAVDLACPIRKADGAQRRALVKSLTHHLPQISYLFLTHAHDDHMDLQTLSHFAGLKTKIVVPQFLEVQALSDATGLKEQQFVRVMENQPVRLGEMTVLPFPSFHMRTNGNGEREYGYLIDVQGKRLLFPGDIRDYQKALKWFSQDHIKQTFADLDAVFANLWLGDKCACDPAAWKELIAPFCNLYGEIHAKKTFLCHLYEVGRSPDSMWSLMHAGAVMDRLAVQYGLLNVIPAEIGKSYSLDGGQSI